MSKSQKDIRSIIIYSENDSWFRIAYFNPWFNYKVLVINVIECDAYLPDEINSQKDKCWVFPTYQIWIVYMQRKAHSIDAVKSCAASPMDNFRIQRK